MPLIGSRTEVCWLLVDAATVSVNDTESGCRLSSFDVDCELLGCLLSICGSGNIGMVAARCSRRFNCFLSWWVMVLNSLISAFIA